MRASFISLHNLNHIELCSTGLMEELGDDVVCGAGTRRAVNVATSSGVGAKCRRRWLAPHAGTGRYCAVGVRCGLAHWRRPRAHLHDRAAERTACRSVRLSSRRPAASRLPRRLQQTICWLWDHNHTLALAVIYPLSHCIDFHNLNRQWFDKNVLHGWSAYRVFALRRCWRPTILLQLHAFNSAQVGFRFQL